MVDPENQESSDAGEPQVPWLVKWGAKGLCKLSFISHFTNKKLH